MESARAATPRGGGEMTTNQGLAVLAKQVETQEKITARMSDTLENVRLDLTGVRHDVKSLIEKLDTNIGESKGLDARVASLEARVVQLETRLTEAEKESDRRLRGMQFFVGVVAAVVTALNFVVTQLSRH